MYGIRACIKGGGGRFVWSVAALLLFACLTWSASALAQQEKVDVRLSPQSGYMRLVFQWPAPVTYKIARAAAGKLTVTFDRAAGSADVSSVSAVGDSSVANIAVTSAAGAPLQIAFDLPADRTYRSFAIGSRVIVDIYGATTTGQSEIKAAAAAAPAPAPAPAADKKAETQKAAPAPKTEAKAPDIAAPPAESPAPVAGYKPQANAPGRKPGQAAVSPAAENNKTTPPATAEPVPSAAPVQPAPEAVPPAIPPADAAADTSKKAGEMFEPNVIIISATENVGMAAFERYGYLWIVLDRENITVPPLIKGPQAKEFPAFKIVRLKGGTAYVTRMPSESYIYSEGGGVLWRVVITPNFRDVTPAGAKRFFAGNDPSRGGSLFWPIRGVTRVMDIQDPFIGDRIKVATVESSDQFSGVERDYPELTTMYAAAGLALKSRVDDLELNQSDAGLTATRPGGLALSRLQDVLPKLFEQGNESRANPQITAGATPEARAALTGPDGAANKDEPIRQIFDLMQWTMGGERVLDENQRILMVSLSQKNKESQIQELLRLAKLNLSNARGAEALGFLDFAALELPELADGPEFMAMRGAAMALTGRSDDAVNDLMSEALDPYTEINYWRAYVLADLGDWQQAASFLPRRYELLRAYPQPLRDMMAIRLAEVALRAGDLDLGEGLLGLIDINDRGINRSLKMAWQYLNGVTASLRGDSAKAKSIWQPIIKGNDNLYRTKAGLAHVNLQIKDKEIKIDDAIEQLEALRFVWRGDSLEISVNQRVGELYLDKNDYIKGLAVLRDAAGLGAGTVIGGTITREMSDAFADLFLTDKLEQFSAIEAATIYEEFKELVPTGIKGNRMIQRLAELLVDAEMFDRAVKLLQQQVEHRLQGKEAVRVGIRLAAIQLLNSMPAEAITSLDRVEGVMSATPSYRNAQNAKEILLLRARAMSQLNRQDDALALLETLGPDHTATTLKADIAWQSGRWFDAAEAINDLLYDENIVPGKPLTQPQADLILQQAVAYNLAKKRVALDGLRERYGEAMSKTTRARLFDVVTRPRQNRILAAQETITSIVSEVDLFKAFLESYKKAEPLN